MLLYHVKNAMKNVVRFKRQTLISLFGLITGLSCVFVIAAWAFQEMRYDRFHHQSETLYMVTTEIKGNHDDVNVFPETPPPLAKELLERIPALENSFHFIYLYGGRSLRYKDYSFEEAGIASGPSLLTVFNFPLLQGSALSLDEPVALFR